MNSRSLLYLCRLHASVDLTQLWRSQLDSMLSAWNTSTPRQSQTAAALGVCCSAVDMQSLVMQVIDPKYNQRLHVITCYNGSDTFKLACSCVYEHGCLGNTKANQLQLDGLPVKQNLPTFCKAEWVR